MKRSPLVRKTPMKRGKKLRPVSKDRLASNPEYERSVRQWNKREDRQCEVYVFEDGTVAMRDGSDFGSLRCPKPAENRPHHTKGQSKKYRCDISTFMGSCWHPHHEWIDAHAREARRLGYLIST